MSKPARNVAQLQAQLATVLADVVDLKGQDLQTIKVGCERGFAVAKVAGRINETFKAEVEVAKQMVSQGMKPFPMGSLPIGDDFELDNSEAA